MHSSKGTAWGFSTSFHQLNPCLFLQPEVVGTYLPGTVTLGWESWWGWDSSIPRYSSWIFIHMCYVGPPCSAYVSSTTLNGCGFFNSVVVILQFNSVFVSSKWWWFCILVVILLWLCEQASCVCLYHHPDQRSPAEYFSVKVFCSSHFYIKSKNLNMQNA